MIRRSTVSLVVAVLFLAVNVGGVGIAAVAGELPHAGIHVALALLGAYAVWLLAPGRFTRRTARHGEAEFPAPSAPSLLDGRLTQLEQAVDTVAIEIERIGEGQRYMTRLFAERGAPPAAETRAAESGQTDTRVAAPVRQA
jgi:hypothetical protein